MRDCANRIFGKSPVPTMPDGSVAKLPIDDSAGREHQLNVHGWPPNHIQEYMTAEGLSIQEAFIKNLEIQRSHLSSDTSLSDAQKAALCGSRYANTASEFVTEQMRLDKVLESFKPDKKDNDPAGSKQVEPQNQPKLESEV